MTLRDVVAAEGDPKLRARRKAEYLRDMWAAEWPAVGNPTVTRQVGVQTWSIVFDERPKVTRDKLGNIVGIDAMVRVFRNGVELKVDPHRICINPPILVPDGTTHTVADPVSGLSYEVDNFELNPREAYMRWLVSSLRETPNPAGWRTRGTVTTVYATAPGGASTIKSTNATYATARTGGTLATSSNDVGQYGTYVCNEAFHIFGTSGIPDTDTVSDVVLSMYGGFNGSATDFDVIAAASAYDGGVAVTSDWVSGASLTALTTLASWGTAGYSADYNAFTSVAAFLGAINKTGNTSIILYSSRHSNGDVPTGDEYVTFIDADAAGTTTDPKLDITHAAGGGGAVIPVFMNQYRQRGN